MKPAILIDVDGVLNPSLRHDVIYCKCHPGWLRFRYTVPDGRRLKIFLYPEMGQRLKDLAADTDAELFWMTTWEQDANTEIGPRIGLPELPVIPCPPRPRNFITGGWGAWKAIHAARWANAQQVADHVGRPFVWFDDEYDAPEALAKLTSVRHRVIVVDERKGLTDNDVERARAWLQEREAALRS